MNIESLTGIVCKTNFNNLCWLQLFAKIISFTFSSLLILTSFFFFASFLLFFFFFFFLIRHLQCMARVDFQYDVHKIQMHTIHSYTDFVGLQQKIIFSWLNLKKSNRRRVHWLDREKHIKQHTVTVWLNHSLTHSFSLC